jgi:hypothetical protein
LFRRWGRALITAAPSGFSIGGGGGEASSCRKLGFKDCAFEVFRSGVGVGVLDWKWETIKLHLR